jgi:type IX secretion system PorP/SprF family membrane protein
MKVRTIRILFLTVFSFIVSHILGQVDPHFTQYYQFPLFLNPALAGVISNGNIRASAIYRNQWNTIIIPYSTLGISSDISLTEDLGLGVQMTNQTVGSGGYNNTNIHLSIANQSLKLGGYGDQIVSFGIQAGLMMKSFNRSKLQFADQFNSALGFDPSKISNALNYLQTFDQTLPDFGAGIYYVDRTPDQNINVYFGTSLSHLWAGNDQFIESNSSLPINTKIHGGAQIVANDKLKIYPNLLGMFQGTASEIVIGGHLEYKIQEKNAFIFGSNYRIGDAINLISGYNVASFNIGVSTDVHLSGLSSASKSVFSLEFSVGYILYHKQLGRNSDFACPRL